MKHRKHKEKSGSKSRKRVGIAFIEERTGKHRNTIRRWVAKGKFPPPDYDPSGYQSWFLDVIDAWDEETYSPINSQATNIDACQAARIAASSVTTT